MDYTLENDGADITIVFTCDDDPSYLEVSVHPLPEDVEDLKSYAEELCDSETASLYNGMVIGKVADNSEEYRFRIRDYMNYRCGFGIPGKAPKIK